jgi:hypothetical protein
MFGVMLSHPLSVISSTVQWSVRDTLSFPHAASPLAVIVFTYSETQLREV